LGRAPSTITRELAAGTHPDARRYKASVAHRRAEQRLARPKPGKLASNPALAAWVSECLGGHEPGTGKARSWSPQQISRHLRREFPDDESMRISHEAIYQSLYVLGRGGLRKELHTALRSGRAVRRPQAVTRAQRAGAAHVLPPQVMISERPEEIEDRAVRALGRRPDHRHPQRLGDRDPGRTSDAVPDTAAPARRTRRAAGRRRDARPDHPPTGPPTPLADLGPGPGDDTVRGHPDRRRPGPVVLRPALALATRHQREHQRAATPVLPQRHRPEGPHSPGPRRRRPGDERTTPQGPGLAHTLRSNEQATLSRHNRCCNHRLNPP